MCQVVNLVNWSIDLTFYARVSSRSSAFILENGARYVLIALQASIQFTVNYEGCAEQ